MSTLPLSIFDEGNDANADPDNEDINDHDIITEINKTHPGYEDPHEAIQNFEGQPKNNMQDDKIQISFSRKKISCILQVTTWLLLIYCVICCTYLLSVISTHGICGCDAESLANAQEKRSTNTQSPTISPSFYPSIFPTASPSIKPTDFPSIHPSAAPSSDPTYFPSFNPTDFPSLNPSDFPSFNPSVAPSSNPTTTPSFGPSSSPTLNPTFHPTSAPTEYYETYDHFVGDYKVSAQNESHDKWLLCDGSVINSTAYPLLFSVVRNRFGFVSGNSTTFKLPHISTDAEEIGMIAYFAGQCPSGWSFYTPLSGRFVLAPSGTYGVNVTGGETSHTLTVSEMPRHNHLIAGQDTSAYPTMASGNEVGNVENYPSYFSRSSGYTGSGSAHNNMPPYLVLNACRKIKPYRGNTFIYSG